ncbi:uncharacterized protein LOC112257750 isoform X2 [Oncorhynchus tshawytscha]|uniref:uncharacterized protein LOC112257750 isoform X2 n=1 Tax=Oncorhynchus tshawytscha TaxID=74940 RepID=UPI001C3DB900|nr:uncharacterized protein LOC112257750 isoform X2 [Oncorhynchus tshawytscha]
MNLLHYVVMEAIRKDITLLSFALKLSHVGPASRLSVDVVHGHLSQLHSRLTALEMRIQTICSPTENQILSVECKEGASGTEASRGGRMERDWDRTGRCCSIATCSSLEMGPPPQTKPQQTVAAPPSDPINSMPAQETTPPVDSPQSSLESAHCYSQLRDKQEQDSGRYPRSTERQHPRSTERQHPRSTERQHPRSTERQHPRSTELQHPRSTEQQHPRSTERQHPRSRGITCKQKVMYTSFWAAEKNSAQEQGVHTLLAPLPPFLLLPLPSPLPQPLPSPKCRAGQRQPPHGPHFSLSETQCVPQFYPPPEIILRSDRKRLLGRKLFI